MHRLKYTVIIIIAIFFSLELWVVYIYQERNTALPPNLGNFQNKISRLQQHTSGDKFRFLVVGDTRSEGTFIELAQNIKGEKIDFGVLLGDITFKGNKNEHRWMREEFNTDWDLKFPLFYVIGNHDINIFVGNSLNEIVTM